MRLSRAAYRLWHGIRILSGLLKTLMLIKHCVPWAMPGGAQAALALRIITDAAAAILHRENMVANNTQ